MAKQKSTPEKKVEPQTPAPIAKAVRRFYAPDGEPIRVYLKDGRCAVVDEPRELPAAFHKEALKRGCIIEGQGRRVDLSVPESEDQEARQAAIIALIEEALQAEPDPEDPEAYEEAYGEAFNSDEKPSVRWLEKRLGYNISSEERDAAWARVDKSGLEEEEPSESGME